MTYELHPLCTLFPRLAGAEFDALRDDIKANGLRTPIVLHNGMILDGGNRYRACVEAGVEPHFVEFDGGNVVSFVLSANLHRRHMTAGQQAAIVASAQDWAKAQPASRPEKAGNVAPLSTVADRAAQSGASHRTQKMADAVAKRDPELARKVAHGEVSLPKAAEQVGAKAPKALPAPVAQPEPADEPESHGPSAEELFMLERETAADFERMNVILNSSDALAEVTEKWKQAQAMVEKLTWEIRGLTNENSMLKAEVKRLQRKLDRVEKQAA